MENLKGTVSKKDGLIVLYEGKKPIAEFILTGEDDEWFSAKLGGKHFNFNYYQGLLGMYSAQKLDKNTYQTDEFIDQVKLEEC